MTEPLAERLPLWRARIERALDAALPSPEQPPTHLHEAMRYAVLGGGKRVRPVLVYAFGEALDLPPERLDSAAVAIELIHAYSLIHDDLPAMDDDDLRRGRPTVHRAFDEATAILAGDALVTLAFAHLGEAHSGLDAERRLRLMAELAAAAGHAGMVGGQALDLAATGQSLDLNALEQLHRLKTGALIRATARMALICADETVARASTALEEVASLLGLAFQIRDDLLDVEGDERATGKKGGADAERGKVTYPALLGLEGARKRARELHWAALDLLEPFGQAGEPLRQLSAWIVEREG